MPRASPLLVVPNPYFVLDADGDPAGVVRRCDIRHAFVGATLDLERSKGRTAKFVFSPDAVLLPNEPVHRRLVASGQLLAANLATAQACGLSVFTPPDEALANSRATAIATWLAQHGELPSFAASPDAPNASAT